MMQNELTARGILLLISLAPAAYGYYTLVNLDSLLSSFSFFMLSAYFAADQFNIEQYLIKKPVRKRKVKMIQNVFSVTYLISTAGHLALST
jgi:hypothetical protein